LKNELDLKIRAQRHSRSWFWYCPWKWIRSRINDKARSLWVYWRTRANSSKWWRSLNSWRDS